jgi:phage-related protein
MKPLIWLGSSRDDVRKFPEGARQQAGFDLYRLQVGYEPSDWKPMSAIGVGVKEIRLHDVNEYRVLYVAKFTEAIYVLHAFAKKTHQTAKVDIDLAKARFRQLTMIRGKL